MKVDIVFDGPPEAKQFVEVERTDTRKSIRVGEWVERDDGCLVLRIEVTSREKLRELLTQCTESQVTMFNRMYESVDAIPLDKINWAIQQCERTIAKNEKC